MAESKNVAIHFDRKEGKFVGLTPEKVANLVKAYPGINVLVELMKMSEWLLSVKGKNSAVPARMLYGVVGGFSGRAVNGRSRF